VSQFSLISLFVSNKKCTFSYSLFSRFLRVVGTPSQEAWPENVSLSWTAFPHRQAKHLGAIIPDLNEHGLNLIKYMLMFDPHSRLTASQALRHRYFIDNIV